MSASISYLEFDCYVTNLCHCAVDDFLKNIITVIFVLVWEKPNDMDMFNVNWTFETIEFKNVLNADVVLEKQMCFEKKIFLLY